MLKSELQSIFKLEVCGNDSFKMLLDRRDPGFFFLKQTNHPMQVLIYFIIIKNWLQELEGMPFLWTLQWIFLFFAITITYTARVGVVDVRPVHMKRLTRWHIKSRMKLIARVGRDAIPMNLAMGFFILRNHHHIYCKGWSGGCQASAYEKVN